MQSHKFFLISLFTLTLLHYNTTSSAQGDCNTIDCLSSSINLSTGYDHLNNTVFPTTNPQNNVIVNDPYWILVGAPSNNGTVNLGGPAFVIRRNQQAWSLPLNGSQYISAFQSSGANQANTPNIHPPACQNLATLAQSAEPPYSFRRCFCICNNNTTISINLSVWVDNLVSFCLEDAAGNVLTQIGGPSPQDNQLRTDSGTQCNFTFLGSCNSNINPGPGLGVVLPTTTVTLNKGTYCIRADLRNDSDRSSMGLNVAGSVSAVGGSNLFLKESCCNSSSFISGYKYDDLNCNGELDSNEGPLQGWTINLLSNGNIVQTTTTDVNGYYVFNAQNPGNYVVSEDMQSGWVQTFPSTSTHSVSIGPNEIINDLNFLNCSSPPEPPSNCCNLEFTIERNKNSISNGVEYTTYQEEFLLTAKGAPVQEVRASVVDFKVKNDPEACGECNQFPLSWGSIHPQTIHMKNGLITDCISAKCDKEINLQIGSERINCCEERLYAIGAEDAKIQWFNGSHASSITVNSSGNYWATASKECREEVITAYASKDVSLFDQNFPNLIAPSVISPNSSIPENRILRISHAGLAPGAQPAYNATKYKLSIFSTWGTGQNQGAFRVIEDEIPNDCLGFSNGAIFWDGKDRLGRNVRDGAYSYVLELYNCRTGDVPVSTHTYVERVCKKSKVKYFPPLLWQRVCLEWGDQYVTRYVGEFHVMNQNP